MDEKSKILCVPPPGKGKSEICDVVENELTGYSFVFQNQKYELTEDEDDDLIGGETNLRRIPVPGYDRPITYPQIEV